MYALMHLFHKLFVALDTPTKWESFAPKAYSTHELSLASSSFQRFVLGCVFEYSAIFRPTCYEVMGGLDHKIRESSVKDCLVTWGGYSPTPPTRRIFGSVESLYSCCVVDELSRQTSEAAAPRAAADDPE